MLVFRLLFVSLFSLNLSAQVKFDTIVNKGIYKSYFSKVLKQPIAVSYTLYHGGGEASRENDHFKGDHFTVHDKDYKGSGYDRGHLVPAEDFAYSDSLQEITFSYYNCVPQHPKLNRGKWKRYEAKVRELSQRDTVIVVCYNDFETTASGKLNIPNACYKAVYDVKHEIIFSVAFKNDKSCSEIKIPEKILRYLDTLSGSTFRKPGR